MDKLADFLQPKTVFSVIIMQDTLRKKDVTFLLRCSAGHETFVVSVLVISHVTCSIDVHRGTLTEVKD